jgi:hypothetical protein
MAVNPARACVGLRVFGLAFPVLQINDAFQTINRCFRLQRTC